MPKQNATLTKEGIQDIYPTAFGHRVDRVVERSVDGFGLVIGKQ